MTTAAQEEWLAGRIFHLRGGILGKNWFGPTVEVSPKATNGNVAQIPSKSYPNTYVDLESLGLKIIGVDFYSHALEIKGRLPPNWRPHHSPVNGWTCSD